MTIHFFYFLLDMALWSVLGLGCAHVVQVFERMGTQKKEKNLALFLISAFMSGCFAVLTHGLPESGLSFYSIISVLFIVSGLALFLSPNLLTTIKQSSAVHFAQNAVSDLVLTIKEQSRETLRT